MKSFICLILTAYLPILCWTQPLHPYRFSAEVHMRLQRDSSSLSLQRGAVDLAEIGAYRAVLAVEARFARQYRKSKRDAPTPESALVDYHPENALDAIEALARKHRIVILNEAHFSAQNRVFTRLLIERLHGQGFRHLFVEGLDPHRDLRLNQRKYALRTSGPYLREPQYGNLLRAAIRQGYQVWPYEHDEDPSEKDFLKRWYSREEGQADNILEFLQAHPAAKIVVHCGYGHLGEAIHEGEIIGSMAAVLKKKSGLDPLTINQTDWLETDAGGMEHPFRKWIAEKAPGEASVLKNAAGDCFSQQVEKYDLNVYFPPTKFRQGRPDWLFWPKGRRAVRIPRRRIQAEYPYLLLAFRADEQADIAVPVDILEVRDAAAARNALVLEKGRYLLQVHPKRGEVQELQLQVR